MRGIAAAVVAGLLSIAAVPAAHAHATLVSSDPADGAMIAAPPTQLTLTFNEPVSALVLRLIGAGGGTTVLPNPPGRHASLVVPLPSAIAQGTDIKGTHILSWRVVSLDGHPVGGSLAFSVGAPLDVAARPAEASLDPSVAAGLWAGKIALYAGLFAGVGGGFFLCWFAGGIGDDGRRAIRAALGAGLVAAPLLVGLQGADALDVPLSGLGQGLVWRTGLDTSFGLTAIGAAAALLAALFSLAARTPSLARGLSLAALCGVGLSLALSGHASAAPPQWLTRPAVALHAMSVAFWVGSLAPLASRLRHDADGDAVLGRFSRAIPWAIAALVVSGIVLALVQIPQPWLLVSTAYGQILCAKLLLVALLLALAAWNRFALTPAIAAGAPGARRRLRRSIGAELAIVMVVLGLVAAWRFTPPPRALAIAAAKPVLTHIHTAEAMADLTLEPGRAGIVRASIVIMTGDFGGLDAKEVHLTMKNSAAGIEGLTRPATKGPDAIWRVDGLPIPSAGRWEVQLDILVDDFHKIMLDGTIDVGR